MHKGFVSWPRNWVAASSLDKTFCMAGTVCASESEEYFVKLSC